ncbi:TatD family hydrolase [uncultured Psychrosphaera sp.]|uniref:TatD family hydrolase n=1 Tax=uncultured Psychrosphaera sp. TaxID=1403522 RepID=UPI0026218AE5|nr:TatD family hydrolase [uncultured Psychrosphaera sp.]
MHLIDSHCHLDFSEFESDLSSVINRARMQGVESFVIPGVSSKHWDKQLKLAQAFDDVYCGIGIHPWFLDNDPLSDLVKLESLLHSQSVVAVGECGLDATVDNMALQQQVFIAQIELANRFNKPLIVHHRKTHHLIQQCFKQVRPEYGGVIHAFSGNINDAEKYIDLGFKLGIGGGITYERASKTRTSVLNVGLSNILLETDSPDMPLFGQQGKRNEPQNIVKVAEAVAELFSCSVEEVGQVTSLNTKALFDI